MTNIKRILNSDYFFWAVLAIPSVFMVSTLISPEGKPADILMNSGVFAARFMILSMVITPLMFLTKGKPWVRWLMKRRRALGVAAFAYAALHLMAFMLDKGAVSEVMKSFTKPGMLFGWGVFFIFLPLAITSNDWSLRRLGPRWKSVQRTVYLAAVLLLIHWLMVAEQPGPAIMHFAPLAVLQAYRIWRVTLGRKSRGRISDAEKHRPALKA